MGANNLIMQKIFLSDSKKRELYQLKKLQNLLKAIV